MKLLRVVIALVMAFFAILLALFIFVIKFQDDSPIAKDLRHRFLRFPLLVTLAGLNRPGDFYAHYLSPQTQTIDVYLTGARGADLSPDIQEWIEDIIVDTTGKSIRIHEISNVRIPNKLEYTNEDLNAIWKNVRGNSLTPALYIIYLTSYAEDPGYAGITLHRDTMFIFKGTIDTLSDNENMKQRIEQSTLMHEWGHLVGLGHTKQPDCLMSESVEVYTSRRDLSSTIPIEHCQDSLYDLELLKKEVN